MVSDKGDAVQPPKPCGYVKAGHIKVTPKSCGYINEEDKECQVKMAPEGKQECQVKVTPRKEQRVLWIHKCGSRLRWHRISADM